MTTVLPSDDLIRRFAEETDTSADLGRALDGAERLAGIHAKHDVALTRLRASEARTAKLVEKRRSKSLQG